MPLEETVFQWPAHSKLGQVVPSMCAPCVGDESGAMCFHLQSLFLKAQKAYCFRGLGLEGLFESCEFYDLSFLLVL